MYAETAFNMSRPPIPPVDSSASGWISVNEQLPVGTVLLWADGQPMIGILIQGRMNGRPWQDFMDPRTDELLPWPTHWRPIAPPQGAAMSSRGDRRA
jgi:hypothetical protein